MSCLDKDQDFGHKFPKKNYFEGFKTLRKTL